MKYWVQGAWTGRVNKNQTLPCKIYIVIVILYIVIGKKFEKFLKNGKKVTKLLNVVSFGVVAPIRIIFIHYSIQHTHFLLLCSDKDTNKAG